MPDLSVLIPARNEMFLRRTIEDILEHSQADTEIIAILDGAWADPPIEDDERVTLVYHPVSIGQRAATNEAARLARGEYVMKCDAHCAFGDGFDAVMIADCGPMDTVMPEQRNLHAFDWQCKGCGRRTYQGPRAASCSKCGGIDFEMAMVWEPRANTRQRHYCFDSDLHFQYWRAYKDRAEDGPLVESMSLLGACWMMRRDRYWELGGMDEAHGSWGQMGTEIGCKTHLSGGRLLTNRNTWYAHLFRTQPGFGFPYPMSGSAQEAAREHSRWLWRDGNWPGAIHPLSWLVEKFWPVPGWTEAELAELKASERE
jgi:ribosomal protein L37E